MKILTVTVEDSEMVSATAVFECFPAHIAVARADFVGSYCHQTAGKRQKLQYYKRLFLFLLSIQKNYVWEWQYE